MYFGHEYIQLQMKKSDFLALMLLCQRRERSIPISIFPKVELESSSRGIRTKFLHQTHTHTTTTSFFSALKFDTN